MAQFCSNFRRFIQIVKLYNNGTWNLTWGLWFPVSVPEHNQLTWDLSPCAARTVRVDYTLWPVGWDHCRHTKLSKDGINKFAFQCFNWGCVIQVFPKTINLPPKPVGSIKLYAIIRHIFLIKHSSECMSQSDESKITSVPDHVFVPSWQPGERVVLFQVSGMSQQLWREWL